MARCGVSSIIINNYTYRLEAPDVFRIEPLPYMGVAGAVLLHWRQGSGFLQHQEDGTETTYADGSVVNVDGWELRLLTTAQAQRVLDLLCALDGV